MQMYPQNVLIRSVILIGCWKQKQVISVLFCLFVCLGLFHIDNIGEIDQTNPNHVPEKGLDASCSICNRNGKNGWR